MFANKGESIPPCGVPFSGYIIVPSGITIGAFSIALITQITTISKIRIYDPLHADSTLSGIRLSSEQLDLIDNKIKEFYIGIE